MSKLKRGNKLKALKPFQTIYKKKYEKRWSKSSVAYEGMPISEATRYAARKRSAYGPADFGEITWRSQTSPEREDAVRERLSLPDYNYVKIRDNLRLYYNVQKTEYRFVEFYPYGKHISVAYPSLTRAMLCVKKIIWEHFEPSTPTTTA